jgi:hypothetical protein
MPYRTAVLATADLQQTLREREGSTLLLEECDHDYPIVVMATEEGKHAQCLGRKKIGPTCEDSESARHAPLTGKW